MVGGRGTTCVAFDKRMGLEIWRALTAKQPGYVLQSSMNSADFDNSSLGTVTLLSDNVAKSRSQLKPRNAVRRCNCKPASSTLRTQVTSKRCMVQLFLRTFFTEELLTEKSGARILIPNPARLLGGFFGSSLRSAG
jgi:hypothetical protein